MDPIKNCCEGKEHDESMAEDEKFNIRCCPCPGPKTYCHGVFEGRPPNNLPERIGVDEVRSRAEPMSRRVWANFELLKLIVERYEAVIQRRWAKKSKVKRRQILNLACKS